MSTPFSQPNPFADPAVTVHTDTQDQDYGDVSPATGGAWGQPGAWSSGPTSPQANSADPPHGGQQSAEDKIRAAKEAELKKKEAELAQRERQMKQQRGGLGAKNWPRCWPILYHDIDAEIPAGLRRIVAHGYWTYLLLVATLSYNLLAITLSLVEDVAILGWIFAAIFAIVGIPGAWILWYGRLYNAAKHDRSLTFGCFFMGYLGHMIFCIFALLGAPLGWGAKAFTGVFRTVKIFEEGTWIGVIFLIGLVGWLGCVVLSGLVFIEVMRAFRGRDGATQMRNEAEAVAGRAAVNAVARQAAQV